MERVEKALCTLTRDVAMLRELEENEADRFKKPATQIRLERLLLRAACWSARLVYAPANYYTELGLEERRDILQAASVDHLCKSIILENTACMNPDCSDPRNSRYYLVVIQYTTRLNAEKVKAWVRGQNPTQSSKSLYNFRLADAADSQRLSGYTYNSVTPFGMATSLPVLLSEPITRLQPRYFWFGGGEERLKLGMTVEDFSRSLHPFVVDVCF